MSQNVVPVCERAGRNRIRRGLESAKPSTEQVGSQGAEGEDQNGSGEPEFLEFHLLAAINRGKIRSTGSRWRGEDRAEPGQPDPPALCDNPPENPPGIWPCR